MKRITRKLIALTAFFMLLNCETEEEPAEKEHEEEVIPNKKLPKTEEEPTEGNKLSEAEKKKIESFWVIPYMQISMIIFYEHVSGKTNENKEEVIPEMPNIIVEQEDNL